MLDTFLDTNDVVAKQKYDDLSVDADRVEGGIIRLERRLYDSSDRQNKLGNVLALLENFEALWSELTPDEQKQALQSVFIQVKANEGHLTHWEVAEEFAPFVPSLENSVRCYAKPRNIKELNQELVELRGRKTIRAFAAELGVSETYYGEIERGLKSMSPFMRRKIDDWKAQSLPH